MVLSWAVLSQPSLLTGIIQPDMEKRDVVFGRAIKG